MLGSGKPNLKSRNMSCTTSVIVFARERVGESVAHSISSTDVMSCGVGKAGLCGWLGGSVGCGSQVPLAAPISEDY